MKEKQNIVNLIHKAVCAKLKHGHSKDDLIVLVNAKCIIEISQAIGRLLPSESENSLILGCEMKKVKQQKLFEVKLKSEIK